MTSYISILRGINVSGQKKIIMTDLKALYEGLGFENVITYIQSGNVIFQTKENLSDQALAATIEAEIQEKYGFQVPVIIRSIAEIEQCIAANPFVQDDSVDVEKLHVTFLAETPAQARLEGIQNVDAKQDRFVAIGRELYLYCPGGYGETKLSNNFFENKLKVSATTRNWKTVQKLRDLALGK